MEATPTLTPSPSPAPIPNPNPNPNPVAASETETAPETETPTGNEDEQQRPRLGLFLKLPAGEELLNSPGHSPITQPMKFIAPDVLLVLAFSRALSVKIDRSTCRKSTFLSNRTIAL